MAFEDIRVHVRLKLVALWSSLMFFYIYADLFPAVAARAFARNARGKAAFRWWSPGSVAGDVLRDGSALPDAVSLRRAAGAT